MNSQHSEQQAPTDKQHKDPRPATVISPILPEIPASDLDIFPIIGSLGADEEKVQKRASNIMKLSQENEKLNAELKAMTDRLEAAERRREELLQKSQQK
ncbi:hypothetical protein BD779DRAFT_1501587 [Infundibulicybe gibba]|nr:hypothetical protein BD779DRAFT_1501587 [Infundibulicybe gibba]